MLYSTQLNLTYIQDIPVKISQDKKSHRCNGTEKREVKEIAQILKYQDSKYFNIIIFCFFSQKQKVASSFALYKQFSMNDINNYL